MDTNNRKNKPKEVKKKKGPFVTFGVRSVLVGDKYMDTHDNEIPTITKLKNTHEQASLYLQ